MFDATGVFLLCWLELLRRAYAAPVRHGTVAVVTFTPLLGKPSINLQRIEVLSTKAGRQGADFVVFPELALSGYFIGEPAVLEASALSAEEFGNSGLRDIAKEFGMVIIAGFAERTSQGFYNSVAIFTVEGTMRVLRKRSVIERWALRDDADIEVFDSVLGKFAVLVCADLYNPQLSYLAAAKGAELLFTPASWWGESADLSVWRARALENSLWLFVANRKGGEVPSQGLGLSTYQDMSAARSVAISPDGQIQWDGLEAGVGTDDIAYISVSTNEESPINELQDNSKLIFPAPSPRVIENSADTKRKSVIVKVVTDNSVITTLKLATKRKSGIVKVVTDISAVLVLKLAGSLKQATHDLLISEPVDSLSGICATEERCAYSWTDSTGALRQIYIVKDEIRGGWNVVPVKRPPYAEAAPNQTRSPSLFEVEGVRFGIIDSCDALSQPVLRHYQDAGAHLLIVMFEPGSKGKVPFDSPFLKEQAFRFVASSIGLIDMVVLDGKGSAYASIHDMYRNRTTEALTYFGVFITKIYLKKFRKAVRMSQDDSWLLSQP